MSKNLFVKSFLTLALAASAGLARADYQIWWQVDQATAAAPIEFSAAKVAYRTSSTGAYSAYLQVTEPAGIPGVSDDLWAPVAEGGTTTEIWWGVLPTETGLAENAYDGYQFRVELYDDNDGLIAVSQSTEVKSLAELKTLQAAYTGTGTHLSSTWVVSNFQAVPEPTSGLLVLIGLAGLALKRKRG